nr:hypothetical protein [Acetobacter syzygii]
MNVVAIEASRIARNCERAVITAYTELRDVGTADVTAFNACTTLYRIHHPEASLSEARMLVSEWIDHHMVRKADGPTPGCNCA